ncbi:FxSxx-COOH system tetratricopeptide repeat protein [Streptomyces melanogenes]|uniref:FxSxx-COOH system tetratricopeptide repeat protein n=1 Tax=Streptomyces melanogenes TaxID=67326 RepID=UPI00167DB780|nr:FxSxx-COOH system tetratricopeptide repeat protein [Streptomyces melanogenes]GGP53449.1 ATP-binding protein [Streptomyces melanogenes]
MSDHEGAVGPTLPEPAEESPRVTVLFAGQSQAWADWIGQQLERAGHPAVLIRWDPLHLKPADSALADLLEPPGHILVVLDDWYLRFDSEKYQGWARLLRDTLPQHRDRVAAVSVTAKPLPPAAATLRPVGLRGVGPDEARRRVLECAGSPGRPGGVVLERPIRFPDDRPGIWNAPRRNRQFTGREDAFERVHDILAASGEEGGRVVIHGLSGVGKTQAAMEYVHRFAGEYDIVWWVGAAAKASAREGFAALAPALDLPQGSRLGEVITAVRGALETTGRRWLVVFDGAESPEAVGELIPEGPGHVLVTANSPEWPGLSAQLVQLPPFDREESVAFARRRAERLGEQDADRLAEAVQDLPLLLDQTATWIANNPAASVADYVRGISQGDPHTVSTMPSREYPASFQAAWSKTLNSLHETSAEAWELLKLLAHFSPDSVPLRLLQNARVSDLPPHLASLVTDPSSWNSALRTLSRVTSTPLEYDDPGRLGTRTVGSLRIHRLLHRFVRGSLPEQDHERATATACRVLVAADPRDPAGSHNWPRYAELIPHLEPSGALASTDPDVRRLVLNCIEYLRVRGEFREGRRLSGLAVESWRPLSGPTDGLVLVATHQLAHTLRQLGEYGRAEELGRDTLRRLMAEGRGGIEVVRAKNGLGGTLMVLGKYAEARALFEEAAGETAALLGDWKVPRLLAIRHNLAVTLALQGHYAKSLSRHDEVLEECISVLGGKDHLTLQAGLYKAQMLRLMGRYGEALTIQEYNHRLHRQILGSDHPQTLTAQHNLALCLRRDGEPERARGLLWEARDAMLRRADATAFTCDYAMLLRDLGRHEEAHALAVEAAAGYEKLLGADHPYTIGAHDNVALVLRETGEHHAARDLAERNLRAFTRVLGHAHPWTLGCAMNTASARAADGDLPGAAELGRAALVRAVTSVGQTHVLSVNLQAGLAQDLRALGRRAQAAELLRDAVTTLTVALGENHRQTAYMRSGARPYWDFEPMPV